MKLLASAAGLAFAHALVPASAAATPRAVDFELAPGQAEGAVAADEAGAAAAGASGGVRSRPLRTPRRFSLVGMRWRGRAEPEIALRVRRRGRWSRWEHLEAHGDHNPDLWRGEPVVAASDPLWVGEADAVQYRMSGRVPGLRLHFVQVARRPPAARAAQGPQPGFVTRDQWGASACPPRAAPRYGSVRAVHVHHTVSLNDYSPQEAPAIVLAICRYHRNSNGWDDIGYQALVDKYGVLYEGRAGGLDQAVVGAQAQGYNDQTAGISNIGDHTSVAQTPEALAAIANYIRWKLPLHGQPTSGPITLVSAGGSTNRYPAGQSVTVQRVLGHRDTNSTACPGNALYAQLDELRALVASGAAPVVPARPTLAASLGARAVDYGEVVPVNGVLTAPDGSPLAGEPVELQVNGDGRWRTARRLIAGQDGSFTTELRPRLRMYVRLVYPGRPDLGGTGSAQLLLRLRPLITVARPSTRAAIGRRLPVRGRVAPGKRVVHLVLQQRIRGRWRQVGVSAARVRRGRFRSSFVPGFVARYRFYVVAKSDLDTDRGSSELYEISTRRR